MQRFISYDRLLFNLTLGALSLASAQADEAANPMAGHIAVLPNVHVSKDRPNADHGEPVICASITDPNKLIAAATSVGEDFRGEYVYYSTDAGRSWSFAMDTFSQAGAVTGDPACAGSPTGAMHFTTMHIGSSNSILTSRSVYLLNYRSPDGGKTWDPVVDMNETEGAIREFSAFDTTPGPNRGRYYVAFNMGLDQRTTQDIRWTGSLALARSLDDGKTWQPPAMRSKHIRTRAVQSDDYEGGNVVVAPDGTVYSTYIEQFGPEVADASVYVVSSSNGGATLSMPLEVSKIKRSTRLHRPTHPVIAVDKSPYHRGTLYVTWYDVSSGRMRVLLASSADGGKTWTRPLMIADAPEDASEDAQVFGPFHPWVSVNQDGIVGIMWLDPRGLVNLGGFNAYFTASLDGGETWLPAARVSEKPSLPIAHVGSGRGTLKVNTNSTLSARVGWTQWDFINGDLAWMDTDLNGRFWPVWVDARTGVRQIWTAPITVSGKVLPAKNLTGGLVPVTDDFSVVLGAFSLKGATTSVEVRLKNTGKAIITGPLMIQAVDLTSAIAQDLRATNSDNGTSSRGAVWDFTNLLPTGGLAPGATSGVKRLAFRLIDPQPTPLRMEQGGRALNINFEVLGNGVGRISAPRTAPPPADDSDED